MIITNGTVGFSKVAKIEDYGVNKKADVSLSFTLGEGEKVDDCIDDVVKLARDKVEAILADKPVRARAAKITEPPAEKDLGAVNHQRGNPNSVKKDEPKKDETPKTKADLEADLGLGGATVVDTVVEDDTFEIEPEKAKPAETITDKDLSAAANRKAESVGGVKVRTLLKEFNPDPAKKFGLADLPQDKRADFLTKLDALS